MSRYPRRYLLIVRATQRDAANNLYGQWVDTRGSGHLTFNMPLALPSQPATVVAYATNTAASTAMVTALSDKLKAYIDANQLRVFRLDNGAYTVETALAAAWTGGLVFATVAE